METEVIHEKKSSLYQQVLTAKSVDRDSYKKSLIAQLEVIAGKKQLTLSELKEKAESAVIFDEDLSRSLQLFTILSAV